MFKFVFACPIQEKDGGRNHNAFVGAYHEGLAVDAKPKRYDSLSHYLNKHQDKALVPYKSKEAYSTDYIDRCSDINEIDLTQREHSDETTNTRNERNVSTLEENVGVKTSDHFITTTQRYPSEVNVLGCLHETEVSNKSAGIDCSISISKHTKKAYSNAGSRSNTPEDRHKGILKSRLRLKSLGQKIGFRKERRQVLANMTQSESVSDSENDTQWLDQPSPILLTSSPPQSALKVPATRWKNSEWNFPMLKQNGVEKVDVNGNFLTGYHQSSNVQQEAGELFFKSLRDSTRYVKAENASSSKLAPRVGYSSTDGLSTTNKIVLGDVGGSIQKLDRPNHKTVQAPTSGQIFLGGGLFLTEDGYEDDLSENNRYKAITKDSSNTKRETTKSLYPVSLYDDPLYNLRIEKTFHNSSRLKEQQTINGNARYYNSPSEENATDFKYKNVISVDQANFQCGDQKLMSATLPTVGKSTQKPFQQHNESGNAVTKSTAFVNGEKHSRKKIENKRMMQFPKHQGLVIDDVDDDATTLTMVTTSDDITELSSSSSDTGSTSTACESICSTRNRNKIYHDKINSDEEDESFVIEKVEHISGEGNEFNGFSDILTSQERRASLHRSISTQSGKLRERLNAVAEDGRSIGDYTKEYYPESDVDMPSVSQYSPVDTSLSQLPNSRISQLREEAGFHEPRTSRSLTPSATRKRSPDRTRRCRSLDRGFRSSFASAISLSRSDSGVRRSLTNRDSLGSDSEVSFNSSLSRRHRSPKSTSSVTSNEQYKPKIDVAESLSALILNPINGGDNDRKTLSDYLKQSSRTNSREKITLSTEELRWRNSKYNTNRDLKQDSVQTESVPPLQGNNSAKHDEKDTTLHSHTSTIFRYNNRPRESKIVSKSQTADRYPAVQPSPRSISSLLPSPRRNEDAEPEVITILDNDVDSVDIVEHEGNRRNSFIEAVTGTSSDYAYSTNSESSKVYENVSDEVTENLLLHEEVNVNLTTHPVSNDLAVAVIRRPSVRQHSLSSTTKQDDLYLNGLANHETHVTNKKKYLDSNERSNYVNLPKPLYNNKSDSLSDIVTVRCRNPLCKKEMCIEDAKTKFKSCHHCYTYYCSQQCRQSHWEKHKLKCIYARVNSDCKKILRMAREDDVIKQAFTRVARTGYLSRGRGCVQVIFSCPDKAERFVTEGLFALESLPLYRTVNDLKEFQEQLTENKDLIPENLIQTCEFEYDAEKSYVLQVLIDIPDEILIKYNRPYRHQNSQGVYIHSVTPVYKYESESTPIFEGGKTPETLILTPPTTIPETWLTTSPSGFSFNTSSSGSQASSPLNIHADDSRNAKRARQLCFINIQRKLREKGVTLRHQYPDVYRKLCAYVNSGTHFTPVVIYPQDTRSGKNFMCLVMPGSEPQILGWVQTPGLLDDIATG